MFMMHHTEYYDDMYLNFRGLDFTNPTALIAYSSATKFYVQKPITICSVFALVILPFIRHILNPDKTK